jgi:esterase/lipase superfamily enzyme
MIVIRALDGTDVEVDENAVTLVSGPYPHDVGSQTYLHALGRGVLVTTEDAAALVARLDVYPPLVKLTRPDLTPVWVKGSAVNAIRPPLATEQQSEGEVNTVLIIGDLHQRVLERVRLADGILSRGSVSLGNKRPMRHRVPLGGNASPKIRVGDSADNADYLVWYGTNRRPKDRENPNKGFSAARDTMVHYGSCRVFIPKSHKIGSIGSPWWKRLLTLTDDRLKLLAVNELQQSGYWNGIATQLAAINPRERRALIFVHGYNVSFREAALRAAQVGLDLSIKGAMAFFSWPSQGSLVGYPADEATIEASEEVIADFMTAFADRSGAKAVHVIAHSMGNRGLLRAVNRIAAKAQRRSGKPFGQIILAAADVDADTFRMLSAAYGEVARRTTLYVSKRDKAVEASFRLHTFPRAGLMPPILVIPGIDTINVTKVDLTFLGHGYVADARDVLNDIHALITHGTPPNRRFGLREASNEQGNRYWLIGA